MALHVHRNIQRLLEAADQLERGVGREQAGHVLDRHGIGAHVLDAFALLHPHIEGVHRAHRVGDGALGVLALFDHRRHRALDVAHVVHGVEHAEHVHAAFRGPLHEGVDHVVGVMAVAEQVLPTQQHLLGRVGHRFLELANPLPGVFAQVADAGVEGGAAPGFQRPETDAVEFLRDRQHVVQAQAGGEQGLVGVAQHHVGDAERRFCRHGNVPISVGRGVAGWRPGWPPFVV